MILERSSENKKILSLIFIILLIAGVFLSLCSPVIFQEGNPWPQIKGMAQLNFSDTGMVKLSGPDNKYMTRSKNGQEVVKNFMKDKGYEFTEQMGAGYLFKSPTGEGAVATHRYYSRYYSLWKITENFDDCVNAGFSIMKSNPPQCATPDGRTFVQGSH